jgi:hypothetical protein
MSNRHYGQDASKRQVCNLKTADLSIADMYDRRRQAIQEYGKARKQQEALRREHVKKMPKKVQARLLRIKEQRRLGTIARAVNGKLQSKSINRIKHDGNELEVREEIERSLLQVNEDKIRASEATPFMQNPLLQDFGYNENREAHAQVLRGTYIPPHTCSKATSVLLKNLITPTPTRTSECNCPTTHITTSDHIKAWKKQKEKTAGGFSDLHFGHFKAHIQDPLLTAMDTSMRALLPTMAQGYRRSTLEAVK